MALAAVHAARPAQIRALQLSDADLGNRRLTIAGKTRPLDDLTYQVLLDWLTSRQARWPHTANPHLLISRRTAPGRNRVFRSLFHAPPRNKRQAPGTGSPCRGPLKMPVLPPSCRCPCRLSRLLVGGLTVATDGQGRSPAGLGPGHQDLPSNGHEGRTVTITYSDRVRRSLCCKSAPNADFVWLWIPGIESDKSKQTIQICVLVRDA